MALLISRYQQMMTRNKKHQLTDLSQLLTICALSRLGRRQAVRHRVLISACVGSNPTVPANSKKMHNDKYAQINI